MRDEQMVQRDVMAFIQRVDQRRAQNALVRPSAEVTTVETVTPMRKIPRRIEERQPLMIEEEVGVTTCFSFVRPEYPISLDGRGFFWPTYDRAPGGPGPLGEPGMFRHNCLRGLILDFDRDTAIISNDHAYFGGTYDVDDPIWFDPGNEIIWWFLPSASALDEILDEGENGSDLYNDGSFNPPVTGVLRVYLYLEMHLDFYQQFSPDRRRVPLGTETDSIPVVLKICYQILS